MHEINLYDVDYASLTDQKMYDLCKTYIEFLKQEIPSKDFNELQFDLTNHLESEFDYLRGYIDHLQYQTESAVLYTIAHLLEDYHIQFQLGASKRFKIYWNIKTITLDTEVDTLKEMLEVCVPYIKHDLIKDELTFYKRQGLILPMELNTLDVSLSNLYQFMKDKKLYIMKHGIETLYILSHYESIPLLCDPVKMDQIVANRKAFDRLKQTRMEHQSEIYFDFLTDYRTFHTS